MLGKARRMRVTASTEIEPRPAEEVITAAAAVTGDEVHALLAALAKHGLRWACQLEQLDATDWKDLAVPLGLKAAIKSELAAQAPSSRSHIVVHSQTEMPERLRRFLLIPGPDGREPPPMGSVTAPFLGILLLPPEKRQHLMMALFELLALISGLTLPLPLMRLHGSASASTDEDIWNARPRIEEYMDGLAIFVSFMLAMVVFNSIAHAMFIAATGWHNVAAWYDTISNSAMFMFITMMSCIFLLFTLVWWQLFVAAVSPYPLLVAVVLSVLFYITMFYLHFYSHTVGLALEMYHLPNWFRAMLRFSNPMLIRALRSSALQPKARQRAAELRVLAARFYSLDDGVLDAGGEAGGVASSFAKHARGLAVSGRAVV